MQIEARQISLVYDVHKDEMTYAFRDVDFCLGAREMVGMVGPSGSGKSSLLYALSGLREVTSGTVYYDDMDIEAFTPAQKAGLRRAKFGFIFQRHFLIDYLSVLDNVLTAVNSGDALYTQKAMGLLEKLKIAHLAGRMPYQLSGGQRQRVAVARALINDPEVIFADEPTASLDHRNAREVMDVLEEYRERASILVVTHDPSILENANRVVDLWDGHLL